MKILFISDVGIIGGATTSLLNLVRELNKYDNIDITVVTSEYSRVNKKLNELKIDNIADYHPEAMREIYQGKHLPLYHIKKAYLEYYLKTIYSKYIIERYIDVKSFDIIHTNNIRTDIGCYLSQKYHIPHIMHVREFGTLDYGCTFLNSNYITYLNKNVDKYVSVSDAVKNHWISLGIDKSKILTIYNGVNSDRFKQKEYFSDLKLKLICCGSIRKSKGQDQIIEAIAMLPEDIKYNISLDLFGWPDKLFLEEILKMANEYGLDRQVNYGGICNDIPNLLLNYDVGITPSRAEGFGLVTNEYMLAGLGVIVSDTGSHKELINENTGLHFEFGNVKDLASKIEKLYYDRDEIKRLGNNARDYALNNFTSKINARNVYNMYLNLLNK